MFERILFATTASPSCDEAARVAFDLAKKYRSHLTTFHVLGKPTRGFSPFVMDFVTGEKETFSPQYLKEVQEKIKEAYKDYLAKKPDAYIEAVTGSPHTEILRKARSASADLIVMGAHSQADDPRAIRYANVTGNTMQSVAKAARCPVLIVSRPCENCWGYFANIVFGTDFSKASDSAFMFAYKLAKEIGTKLYIVHALNLSALGTDKVLPQEEIEAEIKRAEQKIHDRYLSLMEGFDTYEIVIQEGMPYMEILKAARDKYADLIVMAHHTRERPGGDEFLGSTIEQVVLRAACPVISVNRPDKVADM